MIPASIKTALKTGLDALIKANGTRDITATAFNAWLTSFLDGVRSTIHEGAAAPTVAPELSFWRDTSDGNKLKVQDRTQAGNPFVALNIGDPSVYTVKVDLAGPGPETISLGALEQLNGFTVISNVAQNVTVEIMGYRQVVPNMPFAANEWQIFNTQYLSVTGQDIEVTGNVSILMTIAKFQ